MQKFILFVLTFLLFIHGCNSPGSGNNEGSGTAFSHTQNVGASANDFLSSSSFTSLVIEVDYISGFKPSETALGNLKNFLERRLNKPGGITINLDDELASPDKNIFSAQDAYDIEKEYRDTFTDERILAAYFIVLDGKFEQENVLGFAYFNTSMALVGGTIEENSGSFGQPSRTVVETAVLNHEFGHILGLVDNGTPAIQDHKDEQNGSHCNVESCLMYYAVRTSDFMSNLMGGNIPELEEQCIQDLQANGGK